MNRMWLIYGGFFMLLPLIITFNVASGSVIHSQSGATDDPCAGK